MSQTSNESPDRVADPSTAAGSATSRDNDSVFDRYDGRADASDTGASAGLPLWQVIAAAAITALVVSWLWGMLFGGGGAETRDQVASLEAEKAAQAESVSALTARLAALEGELAEQRAAQAAAQQALEDRQAEIDVALQAQTDAIANQAESAAAAIAGVERSALAAMPTDADRDAAQAEFGEQLSGQITSQLSQSLGASVMAASADNRAALDNEVMALTSRIDGLEADVTTQIDRSVAALESDLKADVARVGDDAETALAEAIATVRSEITTLDETASEARAAVQSAMMTSLETQIAESKRTTKEELTAELGPMLSADITAQISSSLGRSANQLQAVNGLRAAIEEGAPLQESISAVAPFADAELTSVLDGLQSRAATLGVPSQADLTGQFDQVSARLSEAVRGQVPANEETFAARLSSAFSAQEGAAPTAANAAVQNLEASLMPFRSALADGDVSAAIDAYNGLDDDLRDQLSPVLNAMLARRDGLQAQQALDEWLNNFTPGE